MTKPDSQHTFLVMDQHVKKLYSWRQDPNGGNHGTLTLWPNSPREMQLRVEDLKTAIDLGTRIVQERDDAFEKGQRSMRAKVARDAR